VGRTETRGKTDFTRQHELGMVVVDYHSSQRSDTFLRQRNAIDVRRPTLPLGRTRSVMTGVYGILDIVPDPPEAPADVGRDAGGDQGASSPGIGGGGLRQGRRQGRADHRQGSHDRDPSPAARSVRGGPRRPPASQGSDRAHLEHGKLVPARASVGS
jgi:hypothetical protein